ncbi:hypothetical protein Rleg9DRAFT_1760 [Rhizobium leguminosarum bv. trifolii WSM597]|uniref:Uncharacterized protein n=1 Tax=Rhizobium leguminosarum bv. trifolii WSM597 TaxID=754764 RepID=J0GZ21_RHILT|nr:hypothetical protein [Rhizobium leguminosarum]EJB02945.1 hypothetical protein Rleg9DRAFT_1760 [Rhizobium leguminosarum bv. trifolii WSM597]
MALMVCRDCQGKVSSSAMACVHCGNVLRIQKPGFLGVVVRVLYFLFTVVLVIVTFGALRYAQPLDIRALMIPVVSFGIWFAVSISLAVLLYVTRLGRVVRVDGATEGDPTVAGSGWSTQARKEVTF